MADKTAFPEASRTNAFVLEPEKFTLVDDPSHTLYDPRVHNPVSNELVESIIAHGVIEPIIVKKNGDSIEVVDGRQRIKASLEVNRRFAADGQATRIKVPFMQRKDRDSDLYGITIAANEIRTQDPPLVKAEKAQRSLAYGKTEREVAVDFGITPTELKKLIGLLRLCPDAREALQNDEISVTAASKLVPLSTAEQKKRLESLRDQGGKITAVRVEKEVRNTDAPPVRRMPSKKRIQQMRETWTVVTEFDRGYQAALDWVLGTEEKEPENGEI